MRTFKKLNIFYKIQKFASAYGWAAEQRWALVPQTGPGLDQFQRLNPHNTHQVHAPNQGRANHVAQPASV